MTCIKRGRPGEWLLEPDRVVSSPEAKAASDGGKT